MCQNFANAGAKVVQFFAFANVSGYFFLSFLQSVGTAQVVA